MNGFKVVIKHDRYSRKPININFEVSLIDREGCTMHSICFKERLFDFGMWKARQHKEFFERPGVQLGFFAADLSQKLGFKVNTNEGLEQFVYDVIAHAPADALKEIMNSIESKKNKQLIKEELTKRGEINHEEAICTGSH